MVWGQKHSLQHTCLATSPLLVENSCCWPRPPVQPAATPQWWVLQQASPVYPRAVTHNLQHQSCTSLLSMACWLQLKIHPEMSFVGNVLLHKGRLACLFWAIFHPLSAFLLFNTKEILHELLSQQGFIFSPGRAYGDKKMSLLWWDVVRGYTNKNKLFKKWKFKTQIPIIVFSIRLLLGKKHSQHLDFWQSK